VARIMPAMDRPSALYEQLTSRPLPPGFPRHAILPDYDGLSIARIPDLIFAALGLDAPSGRLREVVSPPRVDRVLLVIFDGLGYNRLGEIADAERDVHALATSGICIPVTTVFPSTTVAALTTYSTGLAPSEHGMLGYRLYLREISAIVNMIQFSVVGGRTETPLPDTFPASSLFTCPTVYEQLGAHDVETHALLPRGIADSGLSRVLYRGATHIQPAIGLSDMLALARQILNKARTPTVVTLYWPGLDSIAHPRGPQSDAYAAEAASVAAAVRREIVGRVEPTLLLVSSDHGFATMRPSDYVPTSRIPELRDAPLFFPVGEPRASYLFLRPERREDVLASAPTVCEGDIVLVGAREALSLGLFGSRVSHPEALSRLGDLLAVSTGARGLLHPYPDAPLLQGMHGGLTADEMIVPLIVDSL
jgi:hypothetical protein